MGENLSPADISAVVGNTDRNNFGYAYPVFPYGGGFGNNGFGGGYGADWLWIIIILALFGRIQRKRKRIRWRIQQ